MARAGIGLGSNLGDRETHLRAATRRIEALPGTRILARSGTWESDPVDCPPGSPPFLNAVVEVETGLPPYELLDGLQAVETDLGRPLVRPPNSPRPVDLDILFYNGLRILDARLTVPHPRATERAFVLLPLEEIRPGLILPGTGKTVRELAAACRAAPGPAVRRKGALA